MKNLTCLDGLFRLEGGRLDAMILTTYTAFDLARLEECVLRSGTSQTLDLNRVWLYQCNPPNLGEGPLAQRVLRPNCTLGGRPLTCRECLCGDCDKPAGDCPGCGAERRTPQKSFHPKVWLLRFAMADGSAVWRLVVSSKNFAQGSWPLWDGYFTTQGRVAKSGNGPALSPLLSALADSPPALWGELDRVDWEDPFSLWFQDGSRPPAPPWQGAEELHVLSPFVRDDFTGLAGSETKVWLYSESGQIGALKSERWFRLFSCADGGWFHAKLYLWRRGAEWRLMIGSPNATGRAFRRNTEAAVWFPIPANEAEAILSQWREWFPYRGIPGGEASAGDSEALAEQFQIPFSGQAPRPPTAEEQALWRAELGRKLLELGRRALLGCFDGPRPRDFWTGCIRQGPPSQTRLKQAIQAAESSCPELADDPRWAADRDSCRNLLNALNAPEVGE